MCTKDASTDKHDNHYKIQHQNVDSFLSNFRTKFWSKLWVQTIFCFRWRKLIHVAITFFINIFYKHCQSFSNRSLISSILKKIIKTERQYTCDATRKFNISNLFLTIIQNYSRIESPKGFFWLVWVCITSRRQGLQLHESKNIFPKFRTIFNMPRATKVIFP